MAADPVIKLFCRSDATIAIQPIMSTSIEDDQQLMFEALFRVPRSTDPSCHAHVLTLADQLGFSHYIDLFVISKAVEVLERAPNTKISINVSQRSILEDGQKIARRLAASQMCDRLIVEITETSQIPNAWVAAFTAGIREIGCEIAVDDYDTGSADDDLVLAVKPNYLKISMEAVDDSSIERLNRSVAMAKEIGAKVIMERIDTMEKYQLAFDYGIHYLQGYLLSRPFLSQNIASWIAKVSHRDVPPEHDAAMIVPHLRAQRIVHASGNDFEVCFEQKTGS